VVVIMMTDLFISVYFRIRAKFAVESSDRMNSNSSWSEYGALVGQIEPNRKITLFVEDWPSIGTHIGFDLMLSTNCDGPSGIKEIKNEFHPAAFGVKKYYQISV
jgi:hypothetical protein